MAKEKVAGSFWQNFESLVLRDDEARWKAIGSIILIAGACGSIDSTFVGSSLQDTTFMMGALIILMSVIWVAWYCSFREPQAEKNPGDSRISRYFVSRRVWIAQAASLVLFGLSFRVPRAEAREVERKLQQASDDPTRLSNIEEIRKILNRAIAAAVRISSAILATTGLRFVQALDGTPEALTAVNAFFHYRTSFLNAHVPESVLKWMQSHEPPPYWETEYDWLTTMSNPKPQLELYGWAPPAQAARFNPIGKNKNSNRLLGDAFLVVTGGRIYLDGMEIKNVIFKNVDVWYYGWQTSIDNVSLVDCHITIAPHPNANVREFVGDVLTNQQVTFKADNPAGPPHFGKELYSAPRI